MSKKKIMNTEQQILAATSGSEEPAWNQKHGEQTKDGDVTWQAQEQKKHYRILGLQTENFKRIKLVRVRPKGNVLMIGGDNESGKSSLLDSIEVALCGTTNMPSDPVRRGAPNGRIQVDLGDLKIERVFRKSKDGNIQTHLRVEGKNREVFPTPQKLLDELMGRITFDPLEFTRMKPKEQLETLRSLVKIDIDLDAIDEQYRANYMRRRDLGRDIDGAKARIAHMADYADAPDEEIDTAALATELSEANEQNGRNVSQKMVIEELEREEKNRWERVEGGQTRIKDLEAEIVQLRRRIEADEFKAGEINATIRDTKANLQPVINLDSIAERMSAASDTNDKVRAKKAKAIAQTALEELEQGYRDIDKHLGELTAQKTKAIASAKMPIDGLGFGEREVFYNGIPFAQASTAVQIKTSVALAMASNPTLRVLRIKDGSLLDPKSLQTITDLAREHDYQVWIEMVDKSDRVGIVMEDGEATGVEVEKV